MNKSDIRKKIAELTLKETKLEIPEWQATVIIKELNGEQFITISQNSLDGDKANTSLFLSNAILYCTLDENYVYY